MSVEVSHELSDLEREALARLGYASVPELVEACLAAVARSRSIALLAGEGSGKEALYGLAVDRILSVDPGVQALIFAPTREIASRCAAAVNAFDPQGGSRALVWPPAGAEGGVAPPPGSVVLAGRASEILPAVRSGRVRLADLKLLVIDDLGTIQRTAEWPAVEALLSSLPRETPRIVSSSGSGEHLAELLTHQLSRAFRWPPELFGKTAPEPAPGSVTLWYGAASALEERLDMLAAALGSGTGAAGVLCGSERACGSVARGLAARGIGQSEEGGSRVQVGWDAGAGREAPIAAVFGLPSDLNSLTRWAEGATRLIAVVPTRHLAQLLLLARRAGWTTRRLPASVKRPDLDPVERFRALVRDEIERLDPGAELLLLEPLLAEHGTVHVAAALSALLRRRTSESAPVKPWPDVEADSGLAAGPVVTPKAERGTRPAWTRIYVGVGRRDGASPGDIVGAITGETGVVGGQIGKIEIRNSFTLVDIESQVVDEVIRGLAGSTIKGRAVPVRLDRDA
jgi:ATP-dependent RNA helicase DeaD